MMAAETSFLDHEQRLARLRQQQSSIAAFARQALLIDAVDPLLQDAAVSLATGLHVTHAKVMELLPSGGALRIRAGVGWAPGVVGTALVSAAPGSAAGYTLAASEPIVTPDLLVETRFEVPPILRGHGIRSMLNTAVLLKGEPYGILEADSDRPGAFTEDDFDFIRTYADLLAAALERNRATTLLREAEEQSARLLRELQHRVKNNLQVVSNLHVLQSRRTRDPEVRRELEVLASRVEALRLLHEKLYVTDRAGEVELDSYLRDLCTQLVRFHSGDGIHLALDLRLSPVTINVDAAAPLGLIVNEFVTNSVKHAFPRGTRRGRISLVLDTPEPGRVRLVLADNGIGLPQQLERGLGMQLIPMLANQFGAELQWGGAGTTEATLTFAA